MYDSYISKYPLLYGILIIYEDKMIYLYNCIQKTYANGTIGVDRRRRFDILKNFVIKKWRYILTAFIALMIGVAMGPSDDSFNKLENDNNQLNKQLEKLQTENADLAAKVEQAAPWFKMKAAEQEKIDAESKAKEEAEAKAKAEAEAKAKAEAAAKEKLGYETGITYNQLARTPDDYLGEKVKFKGKVIQVMEGDSSTQIRFAVNSDYDTILFAEIKSDITETRILEDDVITIYGSSAGLMTYESTMGGKISIPGMLVEKVDQ